MPEPVLQDDIAAIARIDAVPRILDVVCRTTGMGFAAVARVTEDRWIACSVLDKINFGLVAGGELEVSTTICDAIRDLGQPVVIDNVAEDPVYRDHHTPMMYGFQSYISMPIFRRDGSFFGTLCAIDPHPNRVDTPETIESFRLFADLIAFHLDAAQAVEMSGRELYDARERQKGERAQLASSEAALLGERQSSELREQFIAVLGHDLRNPLSSIAAGVSFISKAPGHPKVPAMLAIMEKSIARMSDLIAYLLDLARGRLGDGMVLERNADRPIGPELEHVVDELRAAWPARVVHAKIAVTEPICCDRARIAQLLSNLVSNALTHGAQDRPVAVAVAVSDGGRFLELSVENGGAAIPRDAIANLFQPFFRSGARSSQQGLGLGLYIASEIARAHGGALDVTSTAEVTRFTFRMPLG